MRAVCCRDGRSVVLEPAVRPGRHGAFADVLWRDANVHRRPAAHDLRDGHLHRHEQDAVPGIAGRFRLIGDGVGLALCTTLCHDY